MTDMSQPIRWEDPPPRSSNARVNGWNARLTALLNEPSRWAVVYEGRNPHQAARQARLVAAALGGRWEFQARQSGTDKERTGQVYARYLGPDTPTAANRPDRGRHDRG